MKKLFIGILFLLVLPNAASAALGYQDLSEFDNLDDTQKAAIVSQMAEFSTTNDTPMAVGNVQEYTEWVDFGTALGVGLASTAKEVGVAADELINTTTGKIAVVLIAYKIVGRDILQITIGMFLWFVISGILIWSYRRICIGRVIKPWPWEKWDPVKIKPVYDSTMGDEHGTAVFLHAVIFCILNIAAIAAMFNL